MTKKNITLYISTELFTQWQKEDEDKHLESGVSGFGAILSMGPNLPKKRIAGFGLHSNKGRMFLLGIVEALRALKSPCKILIVGSQHFILGTIQDKWYEKWRPSTLEANPDKDLWMEFKALAAPHTISTKLENWANKSGMSIMADDIALYQQRLASQLLQSA